MFFWEGNVLSKTECDELINSITNFKQAELYYKGDNGSRIGTVISTQRNALTSEQYLIQDTPLYSKINSLTEQVGYRLKSEKIKFQVVRYNEGHFIYKHRHDMDGAIFLTVVIQLNDENEYGGGEFLYWLNDEEKTLNKMVGNGILIGPEIEHEVKIVTKGHRHSLVLFLEFSDVESLTKQSLI